MATARITEEYPITYDVTKAPVPYGRWAPELLTSWVASGQTRERQRTLFTLCDYLHDPEHISMCLATGLVSVLCRRLEDTDSMVRQKSAQCLDVISGHAVGREELFRQDALTHLSWRFTDDVPLVRRNVHQVVSTLMRTPDGVIEGLRCDLIPLLMDRVLAELPQITLLCLESLRPLLREDPKHGLVLGGVRTMNTLLLSEFPDIRAAAAGCLHFLCQPTQGKNEAVVLGSLSLLAECLQDPDRDVRAQAAAAAGTIMVTTPARNAALKLPMLGRLLALARDEDTPGARTQAFQTLATLGAHPEARTELKNVRAILENAEQSKEVGVKVCAERALSEILWEP